MTGLPLKYSHTDWAQGLARAMGGFASTSFWHRVFALVTFGCFIAYLVRLLWLYRAGRRRGEAAHGAWSSAPIRPCPLSATSKDFFAMLRWFVGLGPKPTFDRWAYWEKFDFWGAAADIVIIGSTGLVLWFPNFFCRFLPGIGLNVAQVIHSTQALLATGFVFAIHFFNTHLRPDIFPVDRSVLTGLVSDEEFREKRPEFFERLRRQGELDALRTTAPGAQGLLAGHGGRLRGAGGGAGAVGGHDRCRAGGLTCRAAAWRRLVRFSCGLPDPAPVWPTAPPPGGRARRGPLGGLAGCSCCWCWSACAGWYTSRPQFCNSCHIMEPYYKSWQASSHKDVTCIECHFPPGLGGKLRGKMLGLVQLAKYVTKSAGPRPAAEIPDASCLRSGCHETRLLTGRVDFHGVALRPHAAPRRKPAAASSSAAPAATARSSRAAT